MNLDIENLTINDLKEKDLSDISWSGSKTHIKNVAEKLEEVQKGEAEYLAVRNPEGKPIAITLINHTYDKVSSEIGQLSVHPDLQGQGLGTRLIAASENRIFEWGHRWAVMTVEVENDRARKLYERLGYREFGQDKASWTAEDKKGNEIVYHADLILLRKETGTHLPD